MDDANRRDLFDQWADHYEGHVQDQQAFPFINYQGVLKTVVDMGRFAKDHIVLDLGIGTGNLSALLPIPHRQIWGVDFSEKMLEQAQRVLPEAHLSPVDLLSNNWPSAIEKPFDRIVSGYVFHEFDDDHKMAIIERLFCDYLASEGLMLIADISYGSLEDFHLAHEAYQTQWDEEEYYWCAEVMIRKLKERGFEAAYVQKSPCAGVYVLHRAED